MASYLFVLFYLAAAAGAVTHRDLFFEHTVKLPFLTGVELPLVAFFALAPLIFVVVHANTLVHLVMLTDKARRYHAALYEKMRDKKGPSDDERIKKRNEKRKESATSSGSNYQAISSSSFSLAPRAFARGLSAGSCGRSPGSRWSSRRYFLC